MSNLRRVPISKRLSPFMVVFLFAGATAALPQDPASQSPTEQEPARVVLTVGDKTFTAAEFEQIVGALPPQFRTMMASLGKKGFAEQFAKLYGLAMEGEKRQLDQGDEFRRMLEFERQILLAQLTMSAVAEESATVGPEEVGYYYQTHAEEFEQAKVSGIYIPFEPSPSYTPGRVRTSSATPAYTEQQAQRKALELRARIRSGQDMATLARSESEHPTASKGGDFGYLGRGYKELPAGIVNSIFSLQPRQTSAPLKYENGFFIFRVEDKRLQPLEQVEQAIQASLSIQKVNRRIESIRDSYPVELDPNYFPDEPTRTPDSSQ